jgi:ribosomal protein S27E
VYNKTHAGVIVAEMKEKNKESEPNPPHHFLMTFCPEVKHRQCDFELVEYLVMSCHVRG